MGAVGGWARGRVPSPPAAIRFPAHLPGGEGLNPYPPQPDSRSSRQFDPPMGVGYGGRVASPSRRAAHRSYMLPTAATRRLDPTDIVGKKVKKHFPGHGYFIGTITGYDAETEWYQVTYSDGTVDDLYRSSVLKFAQRYEKEEGRS